MSGRELSRVWGRLGCRAQTRRGPSQARGRQHIQGCVVFYTKVHLKVTHKLPALCFLEKAYPLISRMQILLYRKESPFHLGRVNKFPVEEIKNKVKHCSEATPSSQLIQTSQSEGTAKLWKEQHA